MSDHNSIPLVFFWQMHWSSVALRFLGGLWAAWSQLRQHDAYASWDLYSATTYWAGHALCIATAHRNYQWL